MNDLRCRRMRCICALDQRTSPSGVRATTASCMESSRPASFLAAALDLGKALAQPLGGLIERGLHGGERIIAILGKAGAQVAVGDAARKNDKRSSRMAMRPATQTARASATPSAIRPDQSVS